MLRNIRRTYWLTSAFTKKHFLYILGTAVLTSLAIITLPQLAQKIPTGKPSHRIARIGQFSVRDLPLDIQQMISNGLTSVTETGEASPSLALDWQIENEGKTYTFNLNTQKTWHDSKNFQAADINYKFTDVDLNVLNASTVQFKLKEPYAPFPTVVSSPIFRKTTSISKILKQVKSELIGTGPYQVKNVTQHGQYLSTLSLESAEDKKTFKFYTTEEAAILGYKLGEIDTVTDLSQPKAFANWKNTTITENTHFDRYVAVFFNTKDANLSDKNFRQALTYAIPAKPQNELRALGPINPLSWAYNPQVKPYETNPKKAQEIIDKIRQEDKSFAPTIRLDTTLAYLDVAESIKSAWEKLGVTTDVRVITYPPQEYQALLAVHQIPPDPDQYTLWHSTQKTNLTQIQNPKIDKLLEDGRKTVNTEERKEIYLDFQRFLLEECPAAFLFYQTTYTIKKK